MLDGGPVEADIESRDEGDAGLSLTAGAGGFGCGAAGTIGAAVSGSAGATRVTAVTGGRGEEGKRYFPELNLTHEF